ncbi:MAG TPA: nucleotide exchange factor GrpE [Elusimicrobiota bacterium]|nr:nucleotide exchange factor GrpE [Elusimicrobiota bacterium]
MWGKSKEAPPGQKEKKSGTDDVGAVAADEKTSELAILKESLDQARAQSAEYYDQLVRLKAEFENFRKRTEKEKIEVSRRGREDVLIQLVGLLDVMEHAETAAHKTTDLKSVVAGLDMLYKEFRRFLEKEGVSEINPKGQKFDAVEHEAVEIVEHDDDGQVLDVLQKGYRFKDALLRPARVKVSKKAAAEKDAGPVDKKPEDLSV